MLRHPTRCIDDLMEDVITAILQLGSDHLPGVASIMRFKVLNIFEEHHWRVFRINRFKYGKKQVALIFVVEAMCSTKRFFLRHSR